MAFIADTILKVVASPAKLVWRQTMRRRKGHKQVFSPTAEAREMLQGDWPASVKQALLLSQRGGRQQKGCLMCGRPGRFAKPGYPMTR